MNRRLNDALSDVSYFMAGCTHRGWYTWKGRSLLFQWYIPIVACRTEEHHETHRENGSCSSRSSNWVCTYTTLNILKCDGLSQLWRKKISREFAGWIELTEDTKVQNWLLWRRGRTLWLVSWLSLKWREITRQFNHSVNTCRYDDKYSSERTFCGPAYRYVFRFNVHLPQIQIQVHY
jgi:hypothetical protein